MFNKKLTQIVHVHPDFRQEGQKIIFSRNTIAF